LVEEEHSVLNLSGFCQSRGLSPASFRNRQRRLAETDLAETEPAEPWVELGRVVSPELAGWDIELDPGHSVCLRLSLAYSTDSIQPVLAVTTGTAERVGAQRMACAHTAGFGVDTQAHGVGDGAT
jgi:hypothetical protein